MSNLEFRIKTMLRGSPLEIEIEPTIEIWRENDAVERCVESAPNEIVLGIARLAATSPYHARFLGQRRELLQRIVKLGPTPSMAAPRFKPSSLGSEDLESFLDELRLFRRDETLVAAIADLSGLWSFDTTAEYLSRLAEEVVDRALARAIEGRPEDPIEGLAVVSLGKLGGREFTYYSDLDLIFLHGGSVDSLHTVSRCVQRFIAYVSTMTGAGTAYVVDARLRPSGQQGTLVASFAAFERYQCDTAALWEHLALVRGRAIAGDCQTTNALLQRTRELAFAQNDLPWHEIDRMRKRVEQERAGKQIKKIHLKAGYGGLMDVEFLAAGACLEEPDALQKITLPSVPQLLKATLGKEPDILEHYYFMRQVESRVRWVEGRSIDTVPRDAKKLEKIAELVSPGLTPIDFLDRLNTARHAIRSDFRRVIKAESIRALTGA